jgi:phosphoribosylglycinamide formyltransferase-1
MLESKGRARREHEEAVTALLEKFRVDLVCLAGYMRVLSAEFVQRWQGRLLNIHPSLLPAFAGLHAQRQALEYGAQIAGCTVHFVDEAVDGGVIVLQRTCAVLPDDTEETLAARILEEEHVAYAEAIGRVISGTYEVAGRRYVPLRQGSGTSG